MGDSCAFSFSTGSSSVNGARRQPACETCGRHFRSSTELRRHINRARCGNPSQDHAAPDGCNQPIAAFSCSSCRKTFNTQLGLSSHTLCHTHPTETYTQDDATLQLTQFCLERMVRDYRMDSSSEIVDFEQFLCSNLNIIETSSI